MRYFFLTLILISAFACTKIHKDTKQINQEELRAKLASNPNLQLIDVRTPEEFNNGAIENAININFFDADFEEKILSQTTPDQHIILYCRSGKRSRKAANILAKNNYTKVYSYSKGYVDWKKITNDKK